MPLLLAIDLSRSPTISRNLTNVLPKSPAETISIPLSLTLGYLIPMIGFAIPAPSWISFDRLQIIMSAWQAFPIWVSLFQQVFKRTLPIFFSRLQPSQSNAIWSLRVAYSFSLGLMVVSRIVAFTVSFAATFFPMVFSGSYAESFSFWSVYVPATISSATQVSSIGEGFFLLLQYDELVGSASVLVWATLLWISGSNSYSFAQRITAFVQWSLLLLLTGSAGCALVLLWLRDEQLIKRSRVAASKSN